MNEVYLETSPLFSLILSLSPWAKAQSTSSATISSDATITAVATTTASSIITDTHISSCRRFPFDDSIEALAKENTSLFVIESVRG